MKLQQETENLIAEAVRRWDELKVVGGKMEYGGNTETETPIGTTHWENPNLLWVYITSNDEWYGGSQTQIGLTKDGRIMWEYQSHCSCNGYEDSTGEGEPIPEDTTKTYELNEVPKEWEAIIQFNLKKILNGKN